MGNLMRPTSTKVEECLRKCESSDPVVHHTALIHVNGAIADGYLDNETLEQIERLVLIFEKAVEIEKPQVERKLGLNGLLLLASRGKWDVAIRKNTEVVNAFWAAVGESEMDTFGKDGLLFLLKNKDTAEVLLKRGVLPLLTRDTHFDLPVALSLLYLSAHDPRTLSEDLNVVSVLKRNMPLGNHNEMISVACLLCLSILIGDQAEFDEEEPARETLKHAKAVLLAVIANVRSPLGDAIPMAIPLIAFSKLTKIKRHRTSLNYKWLVKLTPFLKNPTTLRYTTAAVTILLNYNEDSDALGFMKGQNAFKDATKQLLKATDEKGAWKDLDRLAKKLSNVLNGLERVPTIPQILPDKPEAMISYSWGGPRASATIQEANKKMARDVDDVMVKNGFKVWRDVQEMEANTREKMEQAVDQSDAVLVLLSQAYEDSENCKFELQRAKNTPGKPIVPLLVEAGYKPNGWLKKAIGNEYVYNISDPATFRAELNIMAKKLLVRVKRNATESTTPAADIDNDEEEDELDAVARPFVTDPFNRAEWQHEDPFVRARANFSREHPGPYVQYTLEDPFSRGHAVGPRDPFARRYPAGPRDPFARVDPGVDSREMPDPFARVASPLVDPFARVAAQPPRGGDPFARVGAQPPRDPFRDPFARARAQGPRDPFAREYRDPFAQSTGPRDPFAPAGE